MASIVTLFSVVIVSFIGVGHADKEFVTVQCNPINIGQFGQQSLLDCVIKTSTEVKDPEVLYVMWKKEGVEEPVLMFKQEKGQKILKNREGCKFAEPSWDVKNMNISLVITNTAVKHDGEYTCRVITDSGDNISQTKLSVRARYSNPTITSNKSTERSLTCTAEGGFPKGELRWYDGVNTDWTKSAEFHATEGEDGRFHLSSTLPLMEGSTFPSYTCVVFNASGGKEEEVIEHVEQTPTAGRKGGAEPENHSKWVAPIVVIGSLIVGLLLLLFLRRRSRRARRQSAAPLMDEHEVVPPCEAEEANDDIEKGSQ